LNKRRFISYLILVAFGLVIKSSLVFAANDDEGAKQYLLGTGDMIRIQVYDEQDLYLESRVSDTGTISYPFLGELKVQGLSLARLEALITSRLKGDYLIDPKVSIDMVEYRQFYINGEIASAGGFPYQPGLTVRKAISLAGGFKERASKDKIFIVHDGSSNDGPGTGEPVKATLDTAVRPGDTITIEQSFF